MKKVKEFLKNETVLLVAWLLAILSMFLITPTKDYIDYIDFKTLGLLLSLMFVTAGLSKCRLFEKIGDFLLERAKGIKALKVVLVFLCFLHEVLVLQVFTIDYVIFEIWD